MQLNRSSQSSGQMWTAFDMKMVMFYLRSVTTLLPRQFFNDEEVRAMFQSLDLTARCIFACCID